MSHQSDILAEVPAHAGFLFLGLRHGVSPAAALSDLEALVPTDDLVVGIGGHLLSGLGVELAGMRPMPALTGAAVATPCTPHALFVRVTGQDPGELLHRERAVLSQLHSFVVEDRVSGFRHGSGRDLSGYEDGTENPTGADAVRVAFRADGGPGVAGSCVVAVQRWVHDLDALAAMSREQQDQAIGRDRDSNDELADAPVTAHVKRTAQEDFEPEAFVVRRSMPWRDARGAGLLFLSFAATLDPFEAQLRRMVGLDDGWVDALFSFTRPVTGATFWCPPLSDIRLDLRALSGSAAAPDRGPAQRTR